MEPVSEDHSSTLTPTPHQESSQQNSPKDELPPPIPSPSPEEEQSSEDELICVSPTAPLSPVWSHLTARRKKVTTRDQLSSEENSSIYKLPSPNPSPTESSPVKGNDDEGEESDEIIITEEKPLPGLPKLKMIHRKPVLRKRPTGDQQEPVIHRITEDGEIVPSSRHDKEEEDITDSRNLTIEYRRNVTPPSERDIRGAITGERRVTSPGRGGSFSPEPSAAEKDISSGRKEIIRKTAQRTHRRNPQYRERGSRQHGSPSGSEGTTEANDSDSGSHVSAVGSTALRGEGTSRNESPTTQGIEGHDINRPKIVYRIQPIINEYLNTDGETSVEWK